MSSLSLRLPDSLHAKIRELAASDDVSINQFIATAVAEKAAAMLTLAYLEERAKRGNRAAFDRILARVPDVAPMPGDEIEGEISAKRPNKRLHPPAGAKRKAGPKPRTRARRG
jgi:predicted transcriptional regulator